MKTSYQSTVSTYHYRSGEAARGEPIGASGDERTRRRTKEGRKDETSHTDTFVPPFFTLSTSSTLHKQHKSTRGDG